MTANGIPFALCFLDVSHYEFWFKNDANHP
jgi:hypothetical protein